MKIVNNHANNNYALRNAKRAMTLINLLSNTIKLLQSIPDKLNCLVLGKCNNSNDGDDDNDEDNIEEDDDDDDEDS